MGAARPKGSFIASTSEGSGGEDEPFKGFEDSAG